MLLCWCLALSVQAATWYVKPNGSDGNTGASWEQAFRTLQQALAVATAGDEIWVAAGAYYPDEGPGQTNNDRSSTFQLRNGVGVFGGFAGTETLRTQRNWVSNVTILSGNIDQSGDNSGNAYSVATGSATDATAVLDGFTVKDGNSDDSGGGMFIGFGSPTVRNCTFTANSAVNGGGMAIFFGSPTISNCTFSGNSTTAGSGGGMWIFEGSPTISNCTFSGNSAGGSGGGMGFLEGSPTISHCTFSGNTASIDGGGMFTALGSATISFCTFSGNTAGSGGGMSNVGNSPTINQCTFSGNLAGSGGGMNNFSSSPTVSQCTFSGNTAGSGGGMNNSAGSPTISRCIFSGNSATSWAGALANAQSSSSIANSLFYNNSAPIGGAVFHFGMGSNLGLTNCTIAVNTSEGVEGIGAGVILILDGTASVVNSILWGNSDGLSVFGNGAAGVSYSIVQGGYSGEGNLNADPFFVGAATGNLRLQACSPAIDAGTSSGAPPNDLDGNSRPFGAGIDMGAYEYSGAPVQPPAANCRNLVVNIGPTGLAIVPATALNNGSTGCGTLSLLVNGQSSLIFDCNSLGQHTVTLTVTDGQGSTATCSASIEVRDVLAPVIACPTAQTLLLGANCSASLPDYRILATALDNCGEPGVTQSPAAGTTVSGAGNMTVTLTVTDISGNTAQCSFTVVKVDNTPPTIACPAAQTLPLGANCSASLPDFRSLATANDNCGVQSVAQSPAPATVVSGAGNMTVTLTVTDINGNTAQCSFTVAKVDNIPPSIACPQTQTLILGPDCSASLPDYRGLATVADNCGEPGVTQSPAAGTTVSGAGNMTVTLTVTDISGNTAQCNFTVVKVDNTPPVVQCFDQTLIFNGEESFALDADDLVEASDNCGVGSIQLSVDAITCEQLGQTVPFNATATDLSGNANSCTASVTVTGLPCGWSQQPDGVGCANGNSIAYAPPTGIWTATSTNCFYGPPFNSDATAFAQRTLCGDGSITAQVTSIDGSGWAGVVMRESNAAGAKKAQLMTNLSNFSRREFRTVTNAAAQPQQFPSQNRYWLRLVRAGNQFSMFVSPNGMAWYLAGAQQIQMSSCIQMGLVVTNYQQTSTVAATFANVSYSGGVSTPLNTHAPLNPHNLAALVDIPEFSVFPNPTSGELNLDLTQYAGRSVRIELYSTEGRLLQFAEVDEVNTFIEQIELSAYQSGMYLVKVKSEGLPDAIRRVALTRG